MGKLNNTFVLDYDNARACMRCRAVFPCGYCPSCGADYKDGRYKISISRILNENINRKDTVIYWLFVALLVVSGVATTLLYYLSDYCV